MVDLSSTFRGLGRAYTIVFLGDQFLSPASGFMLFVAQNFPAPAAGLVQQFLRLRRSDNMVVLGDHFRHLRQSYR